MASDSASPPTEGHGGLSSLSIDWEAHADLVLVRLAGTLDIYTAPAFREQVRRFDPAEVQLVVDLTGVGLIDSAGLGALVSLFNHAHQGGGDVGLVCPFRLARLFWISGLRSAFAFGRDLAAVRAELAARRRVAES